MYEESSRHLRFEALDEKDFVSTKWLQKRLKELKAQKAKAQKAKSKSAKL